MYATNCWYAIAWGEELGRELLARTIANQRLIMFRREDGTPVVLEDRCCHRHLPLSKGRLIGDVVQCGYHGLQFDGAGTCVNVPGQSNVPPGGRVRAFPIVESQKFIWAWLGDAEAADESLVPKLERLTDPAWGGKTGNILHLECNYELLNDNLMDLGHETFIHGTSIGHEVVAGTPIKTTRDDEYVRVERWMPDHDPAPFWKAAIATIGYDGNVDRWQQIRFAPPCNYTLHVGVAPVGSGALEGDKSKGVEGCVISINTPETDKSCWQLWAFLRDFKIEDEELSEKVNTAVDTILREDIDVLDAQQDNMDTNPGAPNIDINHDAGGLQARRLVAELIQREQPAASAQAAE